MRHGSARPPSEPEVCFASAVRRLPLTLPAHPDQEAIWRGSFRTRPRSRVSIKCHNEGARSLVAMQYCVCRWWPDGQMESVLFFYLSLLSGCSRARSPVVDIGVRHLNLVFVAWDRKKGKKETFHTSKPSHRNHTSLMEKVTCKDAGVLNGAMPPKLHVAQKGWFSSSFRSDERLAGLRTLEITTRVGSICCRG